MTKAFIKTADGTQITIEGSPGEVAKIIAKVRDVHPPRGRTSGASAPAKKAKEAKKQKSASDLVVMLKEDGFFDKPKRLAEVGPRLEEDGYLFPVTTLSGVMLDLVKKQLLSRKKSEGVWIYSKR